MIIDIKGNLHDERVLGVISHSQYIPTKEKLNGLADKFESSEDIFAFACVCDGFVDGVIVLKRAARGKFEIKSVAVGPTRRNKGIASRLVRYAADTLKCKSIIAETDDDAVGFYRKYGFEVISFGEKYPGIVRYLCTLKP